MEAWWSEAVGLACDDESRKFKGFELSISSGQETLISGHGGGGLSQTGASKVITVTVASTLPPLSVFDGRAHLVRPAFYVIQIPGHKFSFAQNSALGC